MFFKIKYRNIEIFVFSACFQWKLKEKM